MKIRIVPCDEETLAHFGTNQAFDVKCSAVPLVGQMIDRAIVISVDWTITGVGMPQELIPTVYVRYIGKKN